MTWDEVQGDWKQFKGRVKERWGRLTDDDLTIIEGQRERLLGKIQERYGKTREACEKELESFCGSCTTAKV